MSGYPFDRSFDSESLKNVRFTYIFYEKGKTMCDFIDSSVGNLV